MYEKGDVGSEATYLAKMGAFDLEFTRRVGIISPITDA
jgi:hypothetical protein